jgi:hypothetical protein
VFEDFLQNLQIGGMSDEENEEDDEDDDDEEKPDSPAKG